MRKDEFFHFSDEQWTALRKALENHEKANVTRFIAGVENYCKAGPFLTSHKGLAGHRADLDTYEQDLKNAVKALRNMSHKNFNLIPQRHVNDCSGARLHKLLIMNADFSGEVQPAYTKLTDILRTLQNAKARLDNEKPKRGRPTTDPTGLITAMAQLFLKYIGKPTTYDNGPFVEVVRIVLNSLDLHSEDPSRAIKKAIQEISSR